MPKYQYKQYLNSAFWNSLVAVLAAFVAVLIVVFGWQEIKTVMTRIITNEEPTEEKELDRLQLLESLKGDDNISEEEKSRMLEELRSDEEDVSHEEKLRLLESLKSS